MISLSNDATDFFGTDILEFACKSAFIVAIPIGHHWTVRRTYPCQNRRLAASTDQSGFPRSVANCSRARFFRSFPPGPLPPSLPPSQGPWHLPLLRPQGRRYVYRRRRRREIICKYTDAAAGVEIPASRRRFGCGNFANLSCAMFYYTTVVDN